MYKVTLTDSNGMPDKEVYTYDSLKELRKVWNLPNKAKLPYKYKGQGVTYYRTTNEIKPYNYIVTITKEG